MQDFVHQQYPIYKIISKEFLVKGLGSFAWENPQKKKKHRWKLPETAGRRWGNDLPSWEVRYPLPIRHVLSRWFSELPQVEYLILIGGCPLTLLSFTFFYTFPKLSTLPETNSQLTPENQWLEDKKSFWDDQYVFRGDFLLVSGSVIVLFGHRCLLTPFLLSLTSD